MKILEKYEPLSSCEGGFMGEDIFEYDDADDEILDYFNTHLKPLHLNVIVNSSINEIKVDLTALKNQTINLIITGDSKL